MADSTDPTQESHPAHLSPSELGTKEYWETFYARTLNHISTKHDPSSNSTKTREEEEHNPPSNPNNDSDSDSDEEDNDSDPGTSWFSEHNAPEKVLQFLTAEAFPLAPCNTLPPECLSATSGRPRKKRVPLSDEERERQPAVLDLGTGNGSMLALLRKRGGFRGDLVGVDYSRMSVELARGLQEGRGHSAYLSGEEEEEDSEGEEEEEEGEDREGRGGYWEDIRFEEWDILGSGDELFRSERGLDWFPYDKGGFDIVLDKGTFDAVSLSGETVQQRRVCEMYPGIARRLVRKGGFLVVTSCNWTEEELVKWFTAGSSASEADKLVVWGRVEYPRFRFGGREGQGVCTVCFQRVDS